jgi:peptide/nickel transport system permease protein
MSEITLAAPSEIRRVTDAAEVAADLGGGAPLEHSTSRVRYVAGYLRARPGLVLSGLWLGLLLAATLAPALFTAGDPLATVGTVRTAPSAEHVFGTDQIGRDLFTRVVYGAHLSVQAAGVAVAVGLVVGTLVGLLAGYVGGWVDLVLMRIVDVLLSIPGLLLALAFVVALGFGTVNVAIAVGLTSVATNARVLRSEVLKVKNSLFVEAARAGGARPLRVLVRHVLPNSVNPLLTLLALDFSGAILAISSLSFLGYGAQPPIPEWGSLISGGRDFLGSAWWLTTAPGVVIVVTVLAGNRLARAFTGEATVR